MADSLTYTCKRCGYNCGRRNALLIHLSRKKPCANTVADINPATLIEELREEMSLVGQIKRLTDIVTQQQHMLQEILTHVRHPRQQQQQRRTTTTSARDVQHMALQEAAPNAPQEAAPAPAPAPHPAYAVLNKLKADIRAAASSQNVIDLMTAPIVAIQHPFTFNEETGEIVDKNTGYSYGDVGQTTSLLLDAMMKITYDTASELLESHDIDAGLWKDIIDNASNADHEVRLMCSNAIARHIATIVF